MFTDLKSLQTLSFWAFMEASLHSHDWLNHWPLIMDSTSSPSPLPEGQSGIKISNPVSLSWFPWGLKDFPKITLLTQAGVINRGLFWISRLFYDSHHLGNSKGFWSSVPGIGRKTKYIFIIYHNITSSKYFQYFIRLSLKVHWKAGNKNGQREDIWEYTYLHIYIYIYVNKQEVVLIQIDDSNEPWAVKCH